MSFTTTLTISAPGRFAPRIIAVLCRKNSRVTVLKQTEAVASTVREWLDRGLLERVEGRTLLTKATDPSFFARVEAVLRAEFPAFTVSVSTIGDATNEAATTVRAVSFSLAPAA